MARIIWKDNLNNQPTKIGATTNQFNKHLYYVGFKLSSLLKANCMKPTNLIIARGQPITGIQCEQEHKLPNQ